MEDFDVLYKLVLVGDSGVGKTNLLAYFLQNIDDAPFSSSASSSLISAAKQQNGNKALDGSGVAASFQATRKPTIGVEFGTKTIVHPDGTRIRAQIWDTGLLICLSIYLSRLLLCVLWRDFFLEDFQLKRLDGNSLAKIKYFYLLIRIV
jgi:GTPase SAR1 family protein